MEDTTVKKIKIMSEKYMEEHWDELNKDEVSAYQKMSLMFVMKHADELNWHLYSVNPNITLDIIEYFSNRISWVNFCINGKMLTNNVIYNYRDNMVWNILLKKQQLPLQLLIILSEIYRKDKSEQSKSFWDAISRYQEFDLEYAGEYYKYINWTEASQNLLLNELVLHAFLKNLDIKLLLKTRNLSKDFMRANIEIFKPYLM